MDDALYLLAHLAFTDDDGEITAYMTGYGLNAADPGEISIPCNSLEQAQEIFLGWLPEEADVRQDGETLSWNMSDTLGIFQGTAVLKAGGMVVVREYDQDTNTCGILLSTPDRELDFWTFLKNEEIYKKRSRSIAELQLIGKEYRKYWKEIDKALTDGLHNVNGGHYFLGYVHKLDNESLAKEYKCYNLRSDDTGSIDPLFGETFYEAYALTNG